MSDKNEVTEIEQETNVYQKPSFAHRAKRHCVRRWWIYLIILLLIIMVVVLLIVYVAFPKIAQNGVSDSSIIINELKFLNPSPESVLVSQQSTVLSTSSFTPTLDAFNASLSLVTNGIVASVPFTYLEIPSIHATSSSNVTITNATAPISNEDQIAAFAASTLGLETVTINIAGSTDLHEGKLPVNRVHYNETTSFPGLNNLAGFNITEPFINISATGSTPNFLGNAYIPNPSIMTIEMGTVTFALSSGGTTLGNATIENMTLVPGDNSLPLTGIVDESATITKANTSGFVTFDILGQSVVFNGVHIPYYETALSAAPLSLAMNVVQILTQSAASSA